MHSKKVGERRVVELVRDLWSKFPGEVFLDGEAPDFTVSSPEGCVFGYEVTTYFRPRESSAGIPKEQDSLKKQIARRVEAGLQHLGEDSHIVALFFVDWCHLTKDLVSVTADAVLELVIETEVELGGSVSLEGTQLKLPESLASIRISRLEEQTRAFCSVPTATYIPTLGPAEIQAIVNGKNLKIPQYLKRCDEVVLIIEIHGFQPASIADLEDDILTHEFECDFSDVLILMDGCRLMELNVGPDRSRNRKMEPSTALGKESGN